MKRYLRSKARVISSVAQPLLFLIALGFGFGPVYQKASGENYIQFLVPGIVSMSVLFSSMFSGIEVIWDKQFGFLKETLVAPVRRLNIVIGRTLGGATSSILQGIIILIITLFFGFKISSVGALLLAFFFMAMIGILFTALGTAIASKIEDMSAFPLIMNFIIMPLFFLSGALFPLEGLPKGIKIISDLNPLSYGVDGVRGALNGVWHYGLLIDTAVLLGSIAVIFSIASYLFSKIEA